MYTVAHPRFPRPGGASTLGLGQKNIITARKRSLGQGNIFTPVCHSVHRGSAPVHAGIPPPPPPTRHTPWTRHTPPDQASPRAGTPLDQAPPPGPGTPSWTRHPLDQVPPRPGTPPPHPQARHAPPWPGTPPVQSMLGDTVNAWAVRILLECNLVWQEFCRKLHENERNWTERGAVRP